MAIYKPNSCYPFLSTIDLNDAVDKGTIEFECEIETSNVRIDGYMITLYNSDGEAIFNPEVTSDKITFLSDLQTYYSSSISGLNGTLFKFPLFADHSYSGSIGNNIIVVEKDSSTTPPTVTAINGKVRNGNTYRWSITFFQLEPNSQAYIIPTLTKYYDIRVANGTVLGSNYKRIQSVLSDKIYSDYYIQPVYNGKVSDNQWGDLSGGFQQDFATWTEFEDELNTQDSLIFGSHDLTLCSVVLSRPGPYYYRVPRSGGGGALGPIFSVGDPICKGAYYTAYRIDSEFQIGSRAAIKSYDSTFGHIYPVTGENGLVDTDIRRPTGDLNSANAFHIYKFSNQESLMGTTDKVDYCPKLAAAFTSWIDNVSTPGNSYALQNYYVFRGRWNDDQHPTSGAYKPFNLKGQTFRGASRWGWDSNYGDSVKIKEGDRIVLNYQYTNGAVVPVIQGGAPKKYTAGSPYNGIYSVKLYKKTFYKLISGEYEEVEESEWNKSTDSNDYVDITLTWIRTSDADSWGEISNKIVRVGNAPEYSDFANKNIQIEKTDTTSDKYGTINETPFKFVEEKPIEIYDYGTSETEKNTTGIIFYNIPCKNTGIDGVMYVRPASGIANHMMLMENKSYSPDRKHLFITSFDSTTGKITYGEVLNESRYPVEDTFKTDETKYFINSCYKQSDENAFYLSSKPICILSFKDLEGTVFIESSGTVTATARDFTAEGFYSQNENIFWKSFQMQLLDSEGSVVQDTGEIYEGATKANFYGLVNGKNYTFRCIVEDQKGSVITVEKAITASFTEEEISGDSTAVSIELEENHSARISISETSMLNYLVKSTTQGGSYNNYKVDPVYINQLIEDGNFPTLNNWTKSLYAIASAETEGSATFLKIKCRDNLLKIEATLRQEKIPVIKGHKYGITAYINSDGTFGSNSFGINFTTALYHSETLWMPVGRTEGQYLSEIYTINSKYDDEISIRIITKEIFDVCVSNFMLIDLTELYGAGNEPETMEQFRQDYQQSYYEFGQTAAPGKCKQFTVPYLYQNTLSVYKREVWKNPNAETLEGQSIYSPVLIDHQFRPGSNLTFYDYNISNNRYYEYLIFVKSPEQATKYYVYKKYLRVKYDSWTITELVEDESKSQFYKKYHALDNSTWRFWFNMDAGSTTQNIAKTTTEMLSQFPIVAIGPKNYLTGHVSCLLGGNMEQFNLSTYEWEYVYKRPEGETEKQWFWKPVSVPAYNSGGYKEKLSIDFNRSSNQQIDMLKAWRDLCASTNPKLLVDSNGQSFIIQINSASNTINQTWVGKPTSIEFDWTQIASTDNCVITSKI